VLKKKKFFFSQTKLRAFSRALCFRTHKSRKSPQDAPLPMTISPTQEHIISFPRKNNQGVARFQK